MPRFLPSLVLLLVPLTLASQAPPTPTPPATSDPQRDLLEKLAGHWVARGTIRQTPTTHDIDAQWVLEKEYVQIHETSRERDASGKPRYEALVYVVWDPRAGEYACLWLDTTGISLFAPEGVGHAKPERDRIPFVFRDPDGGVHTTFSYDRAKDEWSWSIDNESKGVRRPFARLKLTRS